MLKAWWCASWILVACSQAATPPAPLPATPPVVAAPRPASDALRSALVLDSTPAQRIFVGEDGPVRVGANAAAAKPVELAALGAQFTPSTQAADAWTPAPALAGTDDLANKDGTLWVRVASVASERPQLVLEHGVTVLRLFEVASAMPVGASLAVEDPAGTTRTFGYRVSDLRDRGAESIDQPIYIDIDITRGGFHIYGPTSPAHDLPLTASVADLAAAVRAVAATVPGVPWGFIELRRGYKVPATLAVAAMEAMSAANIGGISFVVGERGAPNIEINSTHEIVRRVLRRGRFHALACYRAWLPTHEGRAGTVQLAVTHSGGTNAVTVSSHVGLDDELAACVAQALTTKTATPSGPDGVTAEVILEPDGGRAEKKR